MIELAKEVGLHQYLVEKGKADWLKAKRPDMINSFLKEGFDLKGKVPKIMIKGMGWYHESTTIEKTGFLQWSGRNVEAKEKWNEL